MGRIIVFIIAAWLALMLVGWLIAAVKFFVIIGIIGVVITALVGRLGRSRSSH